METRPFQPWNTFRDEKRRTRIGSYYSPFQVYTLVFQLTGTGLLLNAAFLADYSDDDFNNLKGKLKELTAWGSDPRSRLDNPDAGSRWGDGPWPRISSSSASTPASPSSA
jgi:hypothetical protein